MPVSKKSLSETTVKNLTAENFHTDANGHLVIKNAELANLIKSNVADNLKNKGNTAAISVGVVVGD